ncbi:hypothetical protein ACOBR2_20025 [Telmatobacter bradus]|uniref:hypothetical protein n=1 Tax=Telmatobacter bradus TaxID=474953 RepID=UPI003B431E3E
MFCKWMVLVLLATTSLLRAQQTVSIDHLRDELSRLAMTHKKDQSIASVLRHETLGERLSLWDVEALQAQMRLGPKTTEALNLLVANSALLDPPRSAQPQKPAPPPEELQALWTRAIQMEADALRHLPDFLADRTTHVYSNIPEGSSPVFQLHQERVFQREITYRDGAEVAVDPQNKPKGAGEVQGLVTSGEFGPMLESVLLDLPGGKLHWGHWEKMPAGVAAVLDYQVPEEHSHFATRMVCCTLHTSYDQFLKVMHYEHMPAYHGEISVDATTGSVLRLTVIPEFKPQDFPESASIAINYDWRTIGGQRYLCPVYSVASLQVEAEKLTTSESDSSGNLAMVGMRASAFHEAQQRLANVRLQWTNAVEFGNYHHFASSFRLLPEDSF